MAYLVGSTIAAADYNAFASQSNLLMVQGSATFGYGQSSKSLANVLVGSPVTSVQWKGLRDNIDDFNDHQATVPGTALPASTDFDVGDPILAYDGTSSRWHLASNLTRNNTNRLNADAGQLSLDGSQISSGQGTGTGHKRNTSWDTQVQHEFTATFASNDAARHFFNTGGRIEIHHNMNGAAGAKENSWVDMIGRAGTYVFDASVYYNGNGVGGAPATASTLRQVTTGSAAAYTANDLSIFERRNAINSARGSQGRIITFTVNFNDDEVEGVDEPIIASLTNIIDEVTSTGVILGVGPVWATVISMSAGS